MLLEPHFGLIVEYGVTELYHPCFMRVLDTGAEMSSAVTMNGEGQDAGDGINELFLPIRYEDDAFLSGAGEGLAKSIVEPSPDGR